MRIGFIILRALARWEHDPLIAPWF